MQPLHVDPKNAVATVTRILDGKAIAAALRRDVARDIDVLKARGVHPGLAVVRVGDDPASKIYVRGKLRAAVEVGVAAREVALPQHCAQAEVAAAIAALADDDSVDGILVQLPLPGHLDADALLALVPTSKDVDGFGCESLGALVAGLPGLRACTPAGIMTILAEHTRATGFSLSGKRALVVGRSRIVGKPMALLLLAANATVTIAHSRSANLRAEVGRADVVIAAVGVPKLIQGNWLAPGAIVVDVGIHRCEDGSLCGDVDFANAIGRAGAITPVPGGVGPMTIATLMANTARAAGARR